MKATFRKSFTRDLKKIKEKPILDRVRKAIEEVEAANKLQEVAQLKKMSGTSNCFRIRIGDFRLGLVLEKDTVEFVRCLNRRDLYKFFP
jgi:mRNA interferase RelE/StbE